MFEKFFLLLALISMASCMSETDSDRVARILSTPWSVEECLEKCPKLDDSDFVAVSGKLAESQFGFSGPVVVSQSMQTKTLGDELRLNIDFGTEHFEVDRRCIDFEITVLARINGESIQKGAVVLEPLSLAETLPMTTLNHDPPCFNNP